MGIRDLYKIIPTNLLITYKFEELRGISVAVDISIFLYKTVRSCGENWMSSFMLMLCMLKKHKIKAVCIFDGPNQPVEKLREQQRRRSELAKAIERLGECKRVKEVLHTQYMTTDDETISDEMKETCKRLINKQGRKKDYTNYFSIVDVIDTLDNIIKKLMNQTLPITDVHKNLAKEIVELMGLHCIQADGEAEGLCASLAINGKVDAVMTEDTDVLAYGTALMLAFKDYKYFEQKIIGVYLPSILEHLGLSQTEFTDLCILLGCDYNKRIKAFPQDGKKRKKAIAIGVKHALDFIQEFRTLETIMEFVEDAEPLAYKRCRELFVASSLDGLEMAPYNLQPRYELLEEFINTHKISITIEHIKECYQYVPPTYEDKELELEDSDGIVSEEESNELMAPPQTLALDQIE